MIADVVRERDEAIRDLVLSPSWMTVRLDTTALEATRATLEISWLLDPFGTPAAAGEGLEDGVSMSGGEMKYTLLVDLGEREAKELERDVLESAWLIGAPDLVRTEDENGVRWACHVGGVREDWREPRRIDPVPLRGVGNRLEVEMR